MTDGILIREVDFNDPNDAAAYLQMLDVYARDPMGAGAPLADDVYRRLTNDLASDPAAHGLLAEHAGALVGFATCFTGYSTFRGQPLLNVHDIAVAPEARGRGIGTALLEEITALGRRLGCCKITLEVREDNLPARRRYAQGGFQPAACNLFLEKPLQP